ncbi:hypothetical protein ACVRY7_06065 [Streptococcus ictaluri]|uniref:Lipoprotein n=1 Tax=Streptococcus ictaluri 707-05 TaxID=764299 RepID=G5K1G6_9STRE|nr:hypothetical protein [Streptococcus ictaluri]EHI70318.1 putative lipoprotein [Streptococcus ictaluri 707-05]
MIREKFLCLLFFFLTSLLVLGGCSQQVPSKDYDIAIFDQKSVMTFAFDNDKLQLIEKLKRQKSLAFDQESFQKAKGTYVAKTKEGKDFSTYLASINSSTLQETFRKAKAGEAYSSTTDGTYFYTSQNSSDGIDFYRYDKALNEKKHGSIASENAVLVCCHQMLVIDDSLYALISTLNTDTQRTSTEIWKLDKSLALLEKMDLEEEAAYIRMVNVGKTLYLPEAYKAKDSHGEPQSGDILLVYDVDTKTKDFIPLANAFPKRIVYQEASHQLLIEYDHNSNGQTAWSTLALDTLAEKPLTIGTKKDQLSAYLTINGPDVYFLFPDRLVSYHSLTGKITDFSLAKYGMTKAHAMIIK